MWLMHNLHGTHPPGFGENILAGWADWVQEGNAGPDEEVAQELAALGGGSLHRPHRAGASCAMRQGIWHRRSGRSVSEIHRS